MFEKMSLSNVKFHQIFSFFSHDIQIFVGYHGGKKEKRQDILKKQNLKCLAFCKGTATFYEMPSKYIKKIPSYYLFPTPIIFKNIFIWRNLSVNWRKKLNLQKEKGFCNLPTLGENSWITSTQCVRWKLHIPLSQNDAKNWSINWKRPTLENENFKSYNYLKQHAQSTKSWITKLHELDSF